MAEMELKREQIKAELVKVNVELEKARMAHQETMAGHAAKVATTTWTRCQVKLIASTRAAWPA